jgi:hypothetical protein
MDPGCRYRQWVGYHLHVPCSANCVSPVTDTPTPSGRASQPRLLRRWVFFSVMLLGVALIDTFTSLADHARAGQQLPFWKPLLWELSSVFLLWLLIPAIDWFNRRFLISSQNWPRIVSLHLLATLPFSLLHVSGMVLLRKLGYQLAGLHYDFGAPLSNWLYEYRKDFLSYWLIIAFLYGFRFYALWMQSRQQMAVKTIPAAESGRLVVRKRNREFILNLVDIDRIEADGNYVTLYVNGDSYPLRESLIRLEARLDPRHFARVHRGHIVNLDRIREIQPWDNGDYRIVLKDGSFVNFSRRYRRQLEHLFKPY